jgi:hypothetical protein
MIAITPEPVIGMSRNTDRHGPESPLSNKLQMRASSATEDAAGLVET